MVTSAIIHKLLRLVSLPVDIRNVCVLLAPGFSGLTALATYLFTREMNGDGAGLLAAAFIGIAPGTSPSKETRIHGRLHLAQCRRIIRQ